MKVVRPEGTIWTGIGSRPDAAERFVSEISSHEGAAWVHDMARRHRGESAQITG